MEIVKAIKAEIERRMADNLQAAEKNVLPGYFSGAAREDFDISAFIDNLSEDEPSENIGQPNSVDLEKAAEEYMGTIRQFGDASFTLYADVDVKNAFKAGAKWQKEQIMKNVVETTMIEGSLDNPTFVRRKIIIVKEDEK